MFIGIILAVVFIILTAVCVYGAYKAYCEEKKPFLVSASIGAGIFLICFVMIPFSFHTVDTGEIAVVKHLGRAVATRTAGTHFDLWLTETYQKYDAKVQNVSILEGAYSSDAQTMNISMTLQYQVIADKVMDIATQYGSLEILQNRIQSIATEKAKAVLSAHTAMDIISNRAAMSPAVEQAIKDAVGTNYFVNVTAVVLTNIDFSDAFEMAVEEKMIAEQRKLKADFENETKIAQAEAEAKALLVAAEAEKAANDLLEMSITDKILSKMYLEKWDGVLPSVMSDGAANIMIPISGMNAAENAIVSE